MSTVSSSEVGVDEVSLGPDSERSPAERSPATDLSDHSSPSSNARENSQAECREGDIVGGDSGADEGVVCSIEEMIQNFHEDVYRYSYWLSGSAGAAEDLTQETFLRAVRAVNSLRDRHAAKSWLLRIARNEFLRWRGMKRDQAVPLEELETAVTPSCSLEDAEWVRKGLERLPENFRLIVLAYYFEQLSYQEIAEQLEIPIGTVMSRLSRARQQLKSHLSQL